MLSGTSVLLNSSFRGKISSISCVAIWLGTKIWSVTIAISAEKDGKPSVLHPLRRQTRILSFKITLGVWWYQLGVVYLKLLQSSETTTWNRYQTKLMCSSQTLEENGCNATRGTIKCFSSMKLLSPSLHKCSRHTWVRWNWKCYTSWHIS